MGDFENDDGMGGCGRKEGLWGGNRTRYSSRGPPGVGAGKISGSNLRPLDVLYPDRPRFTTSNRRRTSDHDTAAVNAGHSSVGGGEMTRYARACKAAWNEKPFAKSTAPWNRESPNRTICG